jgi:hypothetical protein
MIPKSRIEKNGKRGWRMRRGVPWYRRAPFGPLSEKKKFSSTTLPSKVELVILANKQGFFGKWEQQLWPNRPATDEAQAPRCRDLLEGYDEVAMAWGGRDYDDDATRKQGKKAVTGLRIWLVSMGCEPTLAGVSPKIAAAYAMILLARGTSERDIDDRKLAPLDKHWERARSLGAVDFNPWPAVRELLSYLRAKHAGAI